MTGSCKVCGSPFQRMRLSGRPRLYCSDACRKWTQNNPGETRSPGVQKCTDCGELIRPDRRMNDLRCPPEKCLQCHTQAMLLAYVPPEAKCKVCGLIFPSRLKHRVSDCCSRKCREWGRRNPGKTRPPSQPCEVCGKPFPSWHNSKVCSPQCRQDTLAEGVRRYNARKRGAATGEPVLRSQIAERDGWRCGICGRKVNADLTGPHPMSKSLDHIIPLSLGGAHDPANVRLAHLVCNVKRGNRMEPTIQLALA